MMKVKLLYYASIFLSLFAIVSKVESNVAIDVLSSRMLFRTTWVRIPRANWCIMAEEACISDSC